MAYKLSLLIDYFVNHVCFYAKLYDKEIRETLVLVGDLMAHLTKES